MNTMILSQASTDTAANVEALPAPSAEIVELSDFELDMAAGGTAVVNMG